MSEALRATLPVLMRALRALSNSNMIADDGFPSSRCCCRLEYKTRIAKKKRLSFQVDLRHRLSRQLHNSSPWWVCRGSQHFSASVQTSREWKQDKPDEMDHPKALVLLSTRATQLLSANRCQKSSLSNQDDAGLRLSREAVATITLKDDSLHLFENTNWNLSANIASSRVFRTLWVLPTSRSPQWSFDIKNLITHFMRV